jgi:hypothetical protein
MKKRTHTVSNAALSISNQIVNFKSYVKSYIMNNKFKYQALTQIDALPQHYQLPLCLKNI